QPDRLDSAGGDGGEPTAVGDREGCERESGVVCGGDVRRGSGTLFPYTTLFRSQREWGGDGGELDAERHGGPEHAHRHLDRLERQPRDLQCDGDGGRGRDDRGGRAAGRVGHRGDRGQDAAVSDREGCERESGGAGGGDVRGGPGERDDHGRQSDDEREWGGGGGELDPKCHGGLEYVDGDIGRTLGQPGDLHGDRHGGGGRDD